VNERDLGSSSTFLDVSGFRPNGIPFVVMVYDDESFVLHVELRPQNI
jgi:hypothetical protein